MQENGFYLEDESQKTESLQMMDIMRREGHFSDAVLDLGGKSIRVHKLVLAAVSRYFFELFSTQTSPEGSNTYILNTKNMDFESLEIIVDYFYTSKINCPYNCVKSLLKTSFYLKVKSVSDKCLNYLLNCLHPNNCLETYKIVCSLDPKLYSSEVKEIGSFIQDNFMSIIERSLEFSQLSCIVVDVIGTASPDFYLSERPLCKLVAQWFYEESLEFSLNRMLEKVKYVLYLTPDNKLVDCYDLCDAPVLDDSEIIQDYKNLCLRTQCPREKRHSYHHQLSSRSNSPGTKSPLVSFHEDIDSGMDPRASNSSDAAIVLQNCSLVAFTTIADKTFMCLTMLDKKLISISIKFKSDELMVKKLNTASTQSPLSDLEDLTFSAEVKVKSQCLMTQLCPMTSARCGFGAVAISNEIFCVGGYGRGDCMKSIESFKLSTNTWKERKTMPRVRGRFSAGVLHGKIIVCGGSNGNNELKSVEGYDPLSNSWSSLPDMMVPRASAGVAVHKNKLYVVGGLCGSKSLASCEVFDPYLNTWGRCPDLNTGRSQTAVCVWNPCRNESRGMPEVLQEDSDAQIVALGGCNAWNCMNSCEIFKPSTQSWMELPPLAVSRRGAGVASFKGMLYVIGGSDGQTSLNSIEIFDPSTSTWSFGPLLTVPRANMGVVVSEDRIFAIGGFGGKVFLKTLEYLSDDSEEWCSYLPQDYLKATQEKIEDKNKFNNYYPSSPNNHTLPPSPPNTTYDSPPNETSRTDSGNFSLNIDNNYLLQKGVTNGHKKYSDSDSTESGSVVDFDGKS